MSEYGRTVTRPEFKAEKILANIPAAIVIYRANEEEDILYANEAMARIFDCDNVEDFLKFIGSSFRHLPYPDDARRTEETIWDQIEFTGGYDYIRYRIITKTGRIKWVEDYGQFVRDPILGDLFYVLIMDCGLTDAIKEIAEKREEKEQQIAGLERDELTGLVPLEWFKQKAYDYSRAMFRVGIQPACLYCNLKDFRSYNVVHGSANGDRLLQKVSHAIDKFVSGNYGFLAREKDDHFVAMCPAKGVEDIIAFVKSEIPSVGPDARIELKAGAYLLSPGEKNTEHILDCARAACKSVEQSRKEYFAFYERDMIL